jgi:hypothetical protein
MSDFREFKTIQFWSVILPAQKLSVITSMLHLKPKVAKKLERTTVSQNMKDNVTLMR